MSLLQTVLLVVMLINSVCLIGLVLMQQGKGADMGAVSTGSTSLFGASGSGNFMTKATAVCASIFFTLCLSLAYLASHQHQNKDLLNKIPTAEESVPEASSDVVIPE